MSDNQESKQDDNSKQKQTAPDTDKTPPNPFKDATALSKDILKVSNSKKEKND